MKEDKAMLIKLDSPEKSERDYLEGKHPVAFIPHGQGHCNVSRTTSAWVD